MSGAPPIRTLLFTIVLALPAASQGSPPPFPGHNGLEIVAWPDGWSSDFDSLETSDLDGDGTLDAVVQEGGRLVFFPMLDLISAPIELRDPLGVVITDVTDFTILRDASEFGGVDAIALLRAGGLELYRWDAGLDDFGLELAVAGSWAGATRLKAVDWDGVLHLPIGKLTDLVGLTNGGLEVLVHERTSGGGWIAGASFTLPSAALEIEPLQYDAGDLELEIGVTDTGGLDIYDPSAGLVVYSRSSSLGAGHMARLEDTSNSDDLVWGVGPDGNGNSFILVISAGGQLQAYPFAGLALAGCASGFVDADARSDLAVTFSDTYEIALLEHQIGPNVFDLVNGLTWSDATPTPIPNGFYGFAAPPAFGDAGGDGLVDLFVPSDPHDGLVVLKGGFEIANPDAPGSFEEGSTDACLDIAYPGDLKVSITLQYPNFPQGADLRLLIFEQSDSESYVDELAVSNCFEGGSQGSTYALEFVLENDGSTPFWQDDDRIFHLVALPVDASSKVVAPAVVASFTMDLEALYSMTLEGWSAPDLVDDCLNCGGCATGGAIIGGAAHVARLPPLAPNTKPTWEPVKVCNGIAY